MWLPLQSCAGDSLPDAYSAEAIEAWVIDADTKNPIEGVVVTANWQLDGGLEGHTPVKQMMILETTTDKNGHFHFPAWGPISRPFNAKLRFQDPQILIFKKYYTYLALENNLVGLKGRGKHSLRKFDFNRETFEIKIIKSISERDVENFSNLNDIVEFSTRLPKECAWKKIPKMIIEINKHKKYFKDNGVGNISTIDDHLFSNDEYFSNNNETQCGSPKVFFRNYLK